MAESEQKVVAEYCDIATVAAVVVDKKLEVVELVARKTMQVARESLKPDSILETACIGQPGVDNTVAADMDFAAKPVQAIAEAELADMAADSLADVARVPDQVVQLAVSRRAVTLTGIADFVGPHVLAAAESRP